MVGSDAYSVMFSEDEWVGDGEGLAYGRGSAVGQWACGCMYADACARYADSRLCCGGVGGGQVVGHDCTTEKAPS